MKTKNITIATSIPLLLGALAVSQSSLTAQESVTQSASESIVANPDLNEAQVWQGRIVKVRGRDLEIRIEGEIETFDVSADVDIRKNRKRATLSTLAPRDFATIMTVGDGDRERVKKIRAFSAR